MIVVKLAESARIAAGVKLHFHARATEWLLAVIATAWGAILLASGRTFNLSHAYDFMAYLAPENVWGAVAVTIGVVRLAALIVNGTWPQRWYSQVSPHVRGAMALLTLGLWGAISVGLLGSGITDIPAGLAVFPSLFFGDLYNVAHALEDAAKVDKARAYRNAGVRNVVR